MSNLVLTFKEGSEYDDLPEVRYHFPKKYLKAALEGVGQQVVYYRPRRGGDKGYFATAILAAVDPDPLRPDHFYARISDYVDFPRFVPWRDSGGFRESAGRNADGTGSRGHYGWALRRIPAAELNVILAEGFGTGREVVEVAEDAPEEVVRSRIQVSMTRVVRDRAFSEVVMAAYERRCAVTRLRLVTPGTRCGLEAAHIRPVGGEHHGPDSVRNGIALSPTYHWLLDEGMLRLEMGRDHAEVVYSKDLHRDDRERLVTEGTKVLLPREPGSRPHLRFIEYHRTAVWERWKRVEKPDPPRIPGECA